MELVTVKFATPPKFVIVAVAAFKVFVCILPDTVKFVKVPSVVMFGWFDVVSVALIEFAVIVLATVRFCNPLIVVMFASAELNTSAVTVPATVILFAYTLPFTVSPLKLPKLVIEFNAVWLNVPLKVPPVIVPGTYRLLIVPLKELIEDEVTLPDTVRFVNVPSVVMFGWFDVVIVPLIVPVLMLLATFKFCSPLMLVRFANGELNTSAVTVPVAVRLLV